MSNINQSEGFDLGVTLITKVFRSQDKAMVESYNRTFTGLFGFPYTQDMMMAAVFKLAKTDPGTCHWILQNFNELDFCLDILEATMTFALEKLTRKGFILGQDFSVIYKRKLLINEQAKTALMSSASPPDQIFLAAVLTASTQV
ncbi:MAG: hypothetical protein KME06_17585 [Kastovskya adunca ATA6-11-RM4]|jgi:hypothetical protein|nr:hypothetical protein [Kastovskya adunca ATA6-11-RM4]